MEEEIADTEKIVEERREKMGVLKQTLYAKFGRSINLDV